MYACEQGGGLTWAGSPAVMVGMAEEQMPSCSMSL